MLFDFRFRNIIDLARDADAGDVLDLDGRQNFVIQLEFEIRAAGQDFFCLFLVFRHDDFRLHRSLLATLRQNVAAGIVQDLIDDFGHEGLAVDLAQMRQWHLARTEPVQTNLALGVVQALQQPVFHILGRHDDFDLALEAGIQSFGDLHHRTFVLTNPAAALNAVMPAGLRAGSSIVTLRCVEIPAQFAKSCEHGRLGSRKSSTRF